MGAKDSNSGPHAHTASALPPQPTPQPRAGYELTGFLNAFPQSHTELEEFGNYRDIKKLQPD